jgi:hypothetical protein
VLSQKRWEKVLAILTQNTHSKIRKIGNFVLLKSGANCHE